MDLLALIKAHALKEQSVGPKTLQQRQCFLISLQQAVIALSLTILKLLRDLFPTFLFVKRLAILAGLRLVSVID